MTKQESQNMEYKRSWHDEYLRWVCGFANAFVHRDYTIAGSEVHVDIYPDRMEIVSPGGMPDGSLVQDLDWPNVPSDRLAENAQATIQRLRIG